MIDETDLRAIVERYGRRFQEFGVDLRTLNSGTAERHRLQHSIHASVGPLEGRSVLDVGCGLAHYYEYLRDRGIRLGSYTGIDIVPEFIGANRARFPEARFELQDASADSLGFEADYVVMCEVFNNRYAHASNDAVVKQAIASGFAAARVAMSIDMVGDYVDYRQPEAHYFSPEEMFGYAKSLTRFVALRHDYLPFHFTLFLYKQPHTG